MKKGRLNERPPPAGIGALLLLFFLISLYFLKGTVSLFEPAGPPEGHRVFVQVSGDIRWPGVYGFHHPPSPRELVDRAGGLLPTDRTISFPPGFLCQPGSSVAIGNRGHKLDLRVGDMSAFCRRTLGMTISINRENAHGLASLPGIGPKTAEAIVRERTKRGGFRKLSEIQSVRGIGPALYRKLKPCISL